MQCASLTTSNDANYGGNNGTGRGYADPGTCQAGQHQYVRAGAASSDTSLDLAGSPLTGTYIQDATGTTNRKTFQVIRVPQHSSLTLSAAASRRPTGTATPAAWSRWMSRAS